MNATIWTEDELFRISFVTMRGWRFGWDRKWRKPGAVRELTSSELESNEFYVRNKLVPSYDGTDFTLNQAFDHECAAERG